ncbi:MAG TPA: PAS domain S-box protein [Nocardioidaceae bacterium]|nr:PAS domain S-box protein [Nocardioidaceae bacterium]
MKEGGPTIVVVDDAAEVRSLVRTRLRLSGRFVVVGEGENGSEAVALVAQHQPALLLMDVSMPGMDGLEALPLVRQRSPDTKVVLYSGFEEEGLAQEAVRLGASAFVEKSAAVSVLLDRLEAVLGVGDSRPVDEASSGAGAVPVDSPALPDQRGGTPVLSEHAERFREVFEEAAIGMATLTLSGRVVRANRALGALVRRPAATLVGELYRDLAHADGERVDATLKDLEARNLDLAAVEHRVDAEPTAEPTAAPRRLLATFAPVRDSSGRPLYLFLQVQDVTAQRLAEEALRTSEERFRLLVATVQDYAIFMLSPEGIVSSWNAGAQRSKGYTAEEIIGRHFSTFYPADVAASGHPEHELAVARAVGHYEEEGWRVRKDGTYFWANVLITAVHDDAGRLVGFAKVTRDISERRQADEALRASEQRFRLLVEAVEDYAIFLLDPSGHVVSWNAGAQRSTGYSADEVVGQHFRVFYPPDKQHSGHPEAELDEALHSGRYEEEGWRVRQDGGRFWANVVLTPVYDEVGRHVGFAKVTRDTTERRLMMAEREAAAAALAEANRELESLNAQLRAAAEEQTQFLAVTAHELRTPVGVLGGSADTLVAHLDDLTPEELAELLAGMTASAVRLRRLLADLLTASRLQASAVDLKPRVLVLADVLAAAAATARPAWPDVEVRLDVPQDLRVLADPDRLGQVFDNLLGNSLRHGKPPIGVHSRVRGEDVVTRLIDHGAGVPPDVVPRLFQRFASGERRSGTGLGLFIARELARAQGGDVTYEPVSDEGPGGFVVTLPRAEQGPCSP